MRVVPLTQPAAVAWQFMPGAEFPAWIQKAMAKGELAYGDALGNSLLLMNKGRKGTPYKVQPGYWILRIGQQGALTARSPKVFVTNYARIEDDEPSTNGHSKELAGCERFDFSEAVRRMKSAAVCARLSWPPGSTVSLRPVKAVFVTPGMEPQNGWQANRTDMLAEDWVEIEPPIPDYVEPAQPPGRSFRFESEA